MLKVSESQHYEYLFSESYFRIHFGKIRKEAKKDGIMILTKQWVQFRKSAKEFLRRQWESRPRFTHSESWRMRQSPPGRKPLEEKESGQCMYYDEELSKTWMCISFLQLFLTTIEIYSLTVPETRSLKSKCCQDRVPSGGSRGQNTASFSFIKWKLVFISF